jgi:hypothetical protein
MSACHVYVLQAKRLLKGIETSSILLYVDIVQLVSPFQLFIIFFTTMICIQKIAVYTYINQSIWTKAYSHLK